VLNFDPERFVAIQSGAVGLAGDIHKIIGSALDDGAENLFVLGSGGVGILMEPAVRLLQTKSTFPVFHVMPAELVVTGSVHLGDKSLVVIPSLSGTTKESIEALAYCKAHGATVLTLTGHADTPLATGADHNLTNFAADDTSSESFYLQSLLVALSLMQHRGEIDDFDQLCSELSELPPLLVAAKEAFEGRAEQLATTIAASGYHIFTGAGGVWPEAFYFGMCILEEMQWIRTRPVHASDFFHGTLELVEEGVSVVLLKGEDATRPLADRVEAFVPSVGGALTVVDARDVALPGISDRVRAMVSPAVLATLLERLSAHLEVIRDHPLTTRRYYRRMAY
jgi:fructoselysine-6-phosphate deglycase